MILINQYIGMSTRGYIYSKTCCPYVWFACPCKTNLFYSLRICIKVSKWQCTRDRGQTLTTKVPGDFMMLNFQIFVVQWFLVFCELPLYPSKKKSVYSTKLKSVFLIWNIKHLISNEEEKQKFRKEMAGK